MPRAIAVTPETFTRFGDLLKHLRRRADLTQRDLAIVVGYSDSQISRMEQSQYVPDQATLTARFVTALQIAYEPEIVARLLELAKTARGEAGPLPTAIATSLTPHNLPLQLTSFIGREKEMAEVKRLLADARLITLVGVGGTGKTRLALQVAADLRDAFPNGIWLVELAPVSNPALVPQTIATVLGLRETPGYPPSQTLANSLQTQSLLLVIDNCEHVIEACAELADALLRACPHLKILTTSREALGLLGETAFLVPPLSLLQGTKALSVETVTQSEALRLFVERTRAVQPDFQATSANTPAITQICQQLDGLPLAIELASARMRALSVEQIAGRLDDRFRLLEGGNRTALPKHQTLAALMDWSYELLPELERSLLRRLSVFRGGWTLESAEAVCAGGEIEANLVLGLLMRLVDKSLVVVEERVQIMHYHLLETIRQYAFEKLLASKGEEDIRRRHLAYFLALAEGPYPEKEPQLQGMVRLERLEAEWDNLRAALDWALEHNVETAVRLVGALSRLWLERGNTHEGSEWLERALAAEARERGEKPLLPARMLARANALLGLADLTYWNRGLQFSIPWYEEGLVLLRELGPAGRPRLAHKLMVLAKWAMEQGDDARAKALKAESLSLLPEREAAFGKSESLNILFEFARAEGDLERARAILEERVVLLKNLGDTYGLWNDLWELGELAVMLGDDQRARAMYEETLAVARAIRSSYLVNSSQSELAHIERRLGHHAQALALYAQTIGIWQEIGQPAALAHELECFAFIAQAHSQAHRAARLLGAAEALRESINTPMTANERLEYDREVSALRAQMTGSAFASAWAEGRAMTREQAIAEALSDGAV